MKKRRRQKENKGISSKFWKIGMAAFLCLLVFDVYIFLSSNILTVQNIEVDAPGLDCANPLQIKQASGLTNSNIFLINSQAVSKKLSEKFYCINSVSISRKFPQTVHLLVKTRVPVADLINLTDTEATTSADLTTEVLATESAQIASGSGYLVDQEGIVFDKTNQESNVPIIYYWGANLNLGKIIGDEVISKTLQVLEKIKTFGIDVKEAKIYSDQVLTVSLTAGTPKLFFAFDKDIDTQLGYLQLILTEAKINNIEMSFIDLRYDKPVVKYLKGDK